MNYEDIKVGDRAQVTKAFSAEDVANFAELSTDKNPIHLDKEYAEKTFFKKNIVHGILVSSLISSALGTQLPGEGSIYMSQELKFLKPVYIGEECTAEVEVLSKRDDKQIIVMKTTVTTNNGQTEVISGQAVMKKL
ncbi:MAG: MaoC family dehydratase [Peptostreptococcaceae bacterium]|nr:MaoC family dehydratase [Peptostreptococcaceae bacterium]